MSADHEILFFISHPWTEILSLACMYNTCVFMRILGFFFDLNVRWDDLSHRSSTFLPRFTGGDCVSKRKRDGCSYREKETIGEEQWQLQMIEVERWQVPKYGDKQIKWNFWVFFPKKAKKRKWSPALLYPNMPSILSWRAEEHRDIIISPPGPSACISVSSSSLAATETNGRVFPADHSHPLLPVPCDRSSELKRGNRSQRKRDSLAYPSGA